MIRPPLVIFTHDICQHSLILNGDESTRLTRTEYMLANKHHEIHAITPTNKKKESMNTDDIRIQTKKRENEMNSAVKLTIKLLPSIEHLLYISLHDAMDVGEVVVQPGHVVSALWIQVLLSLLLDDLVELDERVRSRRRLNLKRVWWCPWEKIEIRILIESVMGWSINWWSHHFN